MTPALIFLCQPLGPALLCATGPARQPDPPAPRRTIESVPRILEVLRNVTHNGFPIFTDPEEDDPEEVDRPPILQPSPQSRPRGGGRGGWAGVGWSPHLCLRGCRCGRRHVPLLQEPRAQAASSELQKAWCYWPQPRNAMLPPPAMVLTVIPLS